MAAGQRRAHRQQAPARTPRARAVPCRLRSFPTRLQGRAVVDMESEFLSLGLDIIGLGVFNFDFGSITAESPVIKARSGDACVVGAAAHTRGTRVYVWLPHA